MAVAASAFNWVSVRSGVWTRIAMGPCVSGTPFQVLEMTLTGPAGAITFTVDGYSASPPFYQRIGGTNPTGSSGAAPPLGSTGNWAAMFAFGVSPWVEFWLLTNRNSWAHIAMF